MNDANEDIEEWTMYDDDKQADEVVDGNGDRSTAIRVLFPIGIVFVSDSIFDLLLVVGSVSLLC